MGGRVGIAFGCTYPTPLLQAAQSISALSSIRASPVSPGLSQVLYKRRLPDSLPLATLNLVPFNRRCRPSLAEVSAILHPSPTIALVRPELPWCRLVRSLRSFPAVLSSCLRACPGCLLPGWLLLSHSPPRPLASLSLMSRSPTELGLQVVGQFIVLPTVLY